MVLMPHKTVAIFIDLVSDAELALDLFDLVDQVMSQLVQLLHSRVSDLRVGHSCGFIPSGHSLYTQTLQISPSWINHDGYP